jgi:hypothetical protein
LRHAYSNTTAQSVAESSSARRCRSSSPAPGYGRTSSARPSKEAERYEGQRWEYRARNLKKVPGMGIEPDFNEHGAAGWEFCAVANDYAIFKRERAFGQLQGNAD